MTVNGGGFSDIASVTVGNLVLTDIQVADKTSLTGKLNGELTAGIYDVKVKTTDGRLVVGKSLFKVFKAGTTTSIRLGDMTITADAIGQTADDRLAASGNVMINGFVHSSGDMEIIVDDMDPDLSLWQIRRSRSVIPVRFRRWKTLCQLRRDGTGQWQLRRSCYGK